MGVYLEHFLLGLMFAVTGAYAGQWCRHLSHRVIVGIVLVAAETLVVVSLVG